MKLETIRVLVAGSVLALALAGCATGPKQEPPPPAPPPTPQAFVITGVNFEFDKAKLTKQGEAILDQVAPALKSRPDARYEVAGHTDSKGTNAYNQGLSERRAKTVYQGLVKRGVAAGQLSTRGYGETMPIAANKTDQGRAENRRVGINPI